MRLFKGTIFGGITYFLLGWIVWGVLLSDFYSTNFNQCANRPEMEMIWWAMIVANLLYALLLSVILNWAGAKNALDGLKTGAIFGGLLGLSMDFSFYSMTTMFNSFTGIMVDVLANTVVVAIVGMVIVLTWGKVKAE